MWLPHSALAVWPLSISGGPVGFAVKLASRPSPSRSLFYLGLVASAVGRMLCAKVVLWVCRVGFPTVGLGFLRLLPALCVAAFFGWLGWLFSGCCGWFQSGVSGLCCGLIGQAALVCFSLPKPASVGKVRVKCSKAGIGLLLLFGQSLYPQAQQVSQRDAPPVGGFGVSVFYQGSVASL